MTTYPLGYDSQEVERLKKQIKLLFPEEFISMIKSDERFLDIGCGSGDIISLLPTTVQYTGIDLKNAVRPVFLSMSNVRIIEGDIQSINLDSNYTFLNFRLVLWSVDFPALILKKTFSSFSHNVQFFIYEPDDSGLQFSPGLSQIDDLARNWRKHVIAKGKNPLIGGDLPKLLSAAGVDNFSFKSKVYLRDGHNITLLRETATNLVNIISKYPGSEKLSEESLKQIEVAGDNDWFEEKYCYAFRI
jgi:SAM-dependent methyltransferase